MCMSWRLTNHAPRFTIHMPSVSVVNYNSLSYTGKSDRYKEQEKNGRDSPAEKKRRKNDNENRDSESDYKQSNKQASSSNSNSHSSKKHSEVKINKHWVRPHLKVKIIDRSYKEGRYYSSKVIVDDVLPGSIVCRTDSGRLLEGEKTKLYWFEYLNKFIFF